ncbi:MAG: aspartyl-trna synthetase [Variibacter sp.]|nr:aspartyl-trna synthetase [Variibacter sp.]
MRRRLAAALLATAACAIPQGAQAEPAHGASSGLAVPRFVSLKAERVNVRGGPAKDHEVTWIFTRSGLPVEVTAEFDNWRRIRDWEGSEGWVYHSLLSGRRTAMTTADPKDKDALIALHEEPDAHSATVARLQPGVVGAVKKCQNGWCRLAGTGFDGWAAQTRLFGVYPNEKVE